MNKTILIFLLALFIGAKSQIPDYIKVCKISNPNLNECIINSVYAIVPNLRKGIPELNVPPLEPFNVKNIVLNSGSGGVSMYANLKDILAWNGSTFEVLDLQSDVPKCWFKFNVRIPSLYLTGHYDINAKLLSVPISGDGDFNLNITECRFVCTLKGKIIVKDGIKHVYYDKIRLNVTIGSSKINLKNLFNNNPTLGKATNDVLNDNSVAFYEVIRPIIENTLGDLFTDIANKISNTFNYDDLFPK